MQGRSVTRIAGWDTHGLPVEIEAEKKLGISGKPEIEEVGIERFNRSAGTRSSPTRRTGSALGADRLLAGLLRPYVTFHTPYIESVWAILKSSRSGAPLPRAEVVPYCPRCGTTLSSHEVAQGYEEVERSLALLPLRLARRRRAGPTRRGGASPSGPPPRGPCLRTPRSRSARTSSTPKWRGGTAVVLAEARSRPSSARALRSSDAIRSRARRHALPAPARSRPGRRRRKRPRLDGRVRGLRFGRRRTGIVHMAPPSEPTTTRRERHDLPLLRPVDDRGCFEPEIPVVGGIFVKEADPLLVEALRARGPLPHRGDPEHSYPHCWRCSSPLIYMARDSWFAATSTLKDESCSTNNGQVSWHPPEVGEGVSASGWQQRRLGAVARPVLGHPAPGLGERRATRRRRLDRSSRSWPRSGGLPEDFDPHRPFIDEVTWPCPEGRARCGGPRRARRLVRLGRHALRPVALAARERGGVRAPLPGRLHLRGARPDPGLVLLAHGHLDHARPGSGLPQRDRERTDPRRRGQKMSKSKGNTVDPWEAIEEFGADPSAGT
jgi:isoleucyl-tRNA synthetase